MKKYLCLAVVTMLMVICTTAKAELQSVQVDGKITINGNLMDLDGDDFTWFEQRTLLGVNADFSDEVSMYIQFDNYSIWGEDFRSMDWESGYDDRATIDYEPSLPFRRSKYNYAEVEIFQSYIEAREMWGTPLMLRIGRQELIYGNEWLIGNNDNGWGSHGLSFDAIRLDYIKDDFTISGVAAKLYENVFGDLFEEDINMYMLYGSYLGFEDITIDLFVIYIDDDSDGGFGGGKEEQFIIARPGYSTGGSALTIGASVGGVVGPVDFTVGLAYQDQDVDYEYEVPDKGSMFYGMSDDEYMGAHVELGYSWDYSCAPRVFIGGAWYEGDLGVGAFNRLFSDMRYTQFPEDLNRNLSNIIVGWIGVESKVTETVDFGLKASYFEYDDTQTIFDMGGTKQVAMIEIDSEIGWELEASLTYHYTEDLAFSLIYAHLFGGDAVNDEDFDYLGLSTVISF